MCTTRTQRPSNTLATRAIAAVLVCGAALGITNTTHASNRDPRVIINATIGGHFGDRRDDCTPSGGYVRAEFERGQCVGREKGFAAGYRDGFYDRCHNNTPTASFCNVSRYFEDGYRNAFGDGYASGFERGTCDRREAQRVVVRCGTIAPITTHCEPVRCEPIRYERPRVIHPSHGPRHRDVVKVEISHRGRRH